MNILTSFFILLTELSLIGWVVFFLSYMVSHVFTGGSLFLYRMAGKCFDHVLTWATLLCICLVWSSQQ